MNDRTPPRLGISGRIAETFLQSEITPLLALTGLLLGLFAVLITPREEEPQIDVTFANVFIPYPGAAAAEVESLVATPAEQIVSEIKGVEHIYSASTPGMAALTVQFKVGEPRTEAIVRLYNAFYSNQDWLPPNAGVGQPLIKPKGIDDVPIAAGTLWSENPDITAADLLRIARTVETEIQRVPGTRDIDIIGGPERVVRVAFDPARLAGYNLSLDDLRRALAATNASSDAGSLVDGNREVLVQAGTFLTTPEEVADLVVGVHDGAPVFLRDVARIEEGPDQPGQYVTYGIGPGHGDASATGRREAIVVGAAVIVTLALTLFASWAWGFTLNRVSLFALIFSIGILVDDAIVVVENIHRHMAMGHQSLTEAIPSAVDEVGGPTILATFTVIAALMPMAFVSGLMGPYMQPIPINASTGMIISLAVAFIFTPWLYRRLFLKAAPAHAPAEQGDDFLHRLFRRIMTPFLSDAHGRRNRWVLIAIMLLLIALSFALVGVRAVVMKMLPLDNKSEFQVVVDMPEGTPVEQTHRVLQALADHLETVPEVANYQLYAGSSAPINFNGLVRQYYLRHAPHQGDIQVNLLDKHHRDRSSHAIALAARPPLAEIGRRFGANVKVVEVPPGPPVMAPLVAEIYGPDYPRQMAVAQTVRRVFEATPDVVDVDDTIEAAQEKLIVAVDRARAARLGISQQAVATAVAAALRGEDMSYLHDEQAKRPVPIRVELPSGAQDRAEVLASLRLRSAAGSLVPLSEIAAVERTTRQQTIYHKDLLPVVYVTGDVTGATDSPLYGLAAVAATLGKTPIEGAPLIQYLTRQPDEPYLWSLKWDGEWQVTYETFRDMGIAYLGGLVLIYLLVVAQFRSYAVPMLIMVPIPLTLIGILPGHALLGQHFTAPSMIGMMALAGIIVRNSILLVDFIQQEVQAGKPLAEATIAAAAVRAKPIALTALAAMLGGFFILDDPIFGGLAVSLIFGLFVSTLLTLIVIPVLYYHYQWRRA